MAVRRGFYFTFDALIALTVMGLAFAILSQTGGNAARAADIQLQESLRADAAAESALQVALRQPMRSAFNASTRQEYVETTVLTADDMDLSVMDAIAILWASGQEADAQDLTRDFFDRVVPDGLAYRIAVDESGRTLIHSSGDAADARFIARASRLISGVARDRPTRGFISRATLTEATERAVANVFFGGYVGDGNVTANVSLPDLDAVTNVTVEGSFAGPFTLTVNGVAAGMYTPTAANLSADTFPVCTESTNSSVCSALQVGDNRVRFNFTTANRSIGGARLRIVYNETTTLQEQGTRYITETKRLHGIDGIINLFSSFSVPGTLHGISGRLHYRMENRTLYLKIGNATVYSDRTIGETTVTLSNDTIYANTSDANLSYAFMSNRTVPVRLGISDIEQDKQRAIADAVSVVDVSGSMDGSPIQEARAAAKTFAHIILNASGNRAGLVAYESVIDTVHPLTTDEAALNSTIDGLTADGGTCIGCGILEATDVVTADRTVPAVEPGSSWRYNTSFPSSEPPVQNGTAWSDRTYDDSAWSTGDAVLGSGGAADTPIAAGNRTFFRKTFFVNREFYTNYTIYVRSDDAAAVFLNGVLLDNDTGDHTGREWNRVIGGLSPTALDDSFERASLAPWTQTSGDPDAAVIDATCGATAGSDALILRWGGGSGFFGPDRDPVRVASDTYDLSAGADTVAYDIKRGGGGACESPEVGEDVLVEYQAANGSWTGLATHAGGTATGSWQHHRHALPAAARHADFRLRFRYPQGSGSDYDYWAVDRVQIGTSIPANMSALRDGNNTLAVELKDDDGTTEFDLAMNLTEERRRSMIVMSDGEANVETSMQDVPDHNNDGTVDARDHTIEAACRANNRSDITVYAVGFGSNADDDTLNRTAQCGGGRYYASDTGELEEVFRQISNTILNASFVGQQVRTTAGTAISTLYPDSYLRFNYTRPPQAAAGTFDLQQTSPRFGGAVTSPKNGSFTVPSGVEVVDAAVTSYSANYWTDRLSIQDPSGDSQQVYRLWDYGQEYRDLGDPFHVQIPPSLVSQGVNNVSVDTGVNRTEPRGGSPDDRVIYTIAVAGTVPYGTAFGKAEGGTTTVQTVAGPIQITVMNASDPWNASNDAIDNATARLLDRLDFDGDGTVDVQLSGEDLAIESQDTGGIEWLWGPASVSVEVWPE